MEAISAPHAILLLVVLIPYFIPTAIAVIRKKKNAAVIAVVNTLLGWTLIGWIVALVWAIVPDAPVTAISNVCRDCGAGILVPNAIFTASASFCCTRVI